MSPMTPTQGRIVIYSSKTRDYTCPAMVLRTRASTNLETMDRWAGVTKPDGLVAELPDELAVDLLVHGLGGDYREYAVPYAETGDPRTWAWPPRV